ncbi:WxL protein peptidoglycan domain-containing protein [Leifsonia sp. NPDC058230]|uniref:WxL protein peptidoglycan domain-containing protein n=1 Tax=Leifsonia sp. NPDC058230 TaxID=3346391 RepID=UPI0036DB6371
MNALATHPIRALVHIVVIAVLVALGLSLVPAGSAQAAGDDVTWTVRTASNGFGAERTGYNYTINPGSKVDDALVVSNHGDTALELGIYAADGYTTESGQFDLVVGGAKSVSIGDWVHGGTDHITVAPGQSVDYPFTVTVPKNATPGDYAGGIVTSLAQEGETQGITVDRRLGIKITLRVSGDLKPSLAVENPHVDWNGGLNPFAGGDSTMTYTIHNTGNALVTAKQVAGLTGPFGMLPTSAGTIKAPPQLLPGEKWDVSVPIHDVPASVWLAATATVTPVVTDASGSTNTLDPITATATGWAVPWMVLLIVVVLAALVFVALRLRTRLRAQQKAREDARVNDAVERALGTKGASASSAG